MSDKSVSKDQYKKLIEEIRSELNQVLDEHVVTKKLSQVEGLSLSETGEITLITDDPQRVVQKLVDTFLRLSNEVVVKTLQPLLKQCPWIRVPSIYGN
jgi:hypothetical protein